MFGTAVDTFLACRRLDMRALAVELGIGRATLYRRVPDRDQLLSAVVWFHEPDVDLAVEVIGRLLDGDR